MSYNKEDYGVFVKKADEKDYELMNIFMNAAKDYFLERGDVNIELILWEKSEEAEVLISSGIITGKTPMMACVKGVEYLSSKYDVKVFCGDSDSEDDVRTFCPESVESVFNDRDR